MIKIAPSILSANFSRLGADVKAAEDGGADILHIDVMDGHFVPNITIGPRVLECLRETTSLPFDVHLMIEKPENYISSFIQVGADIITVHPETSPHLHRTLHYINQEGAKAGVALNPSTSLYTIEDILEDLDMILIMTVNPGFGGQKFIQTLLPKIEKARELIESRGLNLDLEVDGGINLENTPKIVKAGGNILVAGNAVFGEGDISENIRKLRAVT